MKKVLILFVLLFLVTGCGKESVTNLDLKKASEEVASIYTNMEDMDKDELKAIYGLDVSLLDESAFTLLSEEEFENYNL